MNVIQTFHSLYFHQSRAYLEFLLAKKFPEFISFIWHLFWSQLCRSFSEKILGKVKQLEEEASIAIKIEELSKLPKKPQKPLYRKLSSEELAVQKRKSFVDIGSSEEESDDRSTPDPNPEPTWMEDLSYTIQQTTAEAVSSVKSQLEEAISCRLGSEPVRYADSSSSEDHSDYVLLDRETEENS